MSPRPLRRRSQRAFERARSFYTAAPSRRWCRDAENLTPPPVDNAPHTAGPSPANAPPAATPTILAEVRSSEVSTPLPSPENKIAKSRQKLRVSVPRIAIYRFVFDIFGKEFVRIVKYRKYGTIVLVVNVIMGFLSNLFTITTTDFSHLPFKCLGISFAIFILLLILRGVFPLASRSVRAKVLVLCVTLMITFGTIGVVQIAVAGGNSVTTLAIPQFQKIVLGSLGLEDDKLTNIAALDTSILAAVAKASEKLKAQSVKLNIMKEECIKRNIPALAVETAANAIRDLPISDGQRAELLKQWGDKYIELRQQVDL